MQKITAIGNLGRDPEERITSSGNKLLTFGLAVQVNKETTVWYDVNIWQDKIPLFEKIIPFLKKGSRILVMGDLGATETYQSKSGETKIKNKIQPFCIQFINSGEKKSETGAANQFGSVPEFDFESQNIGF